MDLNSNLCITHIITDLSFFEQKAEHIPVWVTNVVFEVIYNDPSSLSALLNAVAFESKLPSFSVLLRRPVGQPSQPKPEWISGLVSLLCMANYFKVKNNHLLFLQSASDNNDADQATVRHLLDRLTQLGFNKVLCVNPGKAENPVGIQLISLKEFIAIPDIFTFLLRPDRHVQIYTTMATLLEQGTLVIEYEKLLSSLDGHSHRSILLHNEMRNKLEEQEERLEFLRDALWSKNKYIEFLLYTPYTTDEYNHTAGGKPLPVSEIQKIKNFYYFEYEILPLWYKRLGHIIKVIMGKRAFRSLFDDNVKKYKN